MSQNLDLFDIDNFKTTHPLYTTKNHRGKTMEQVRQIRKFKSETGSLAPMEFFSFRAKMS